jgi:hypothetical protein
MLIKTWPLFRRHPIQKVHQGVARRGMCPLLFRGFERRRHQFWRCDRLKWPQVNSKVTCNQYWKAFNSISIHWEVAVLWNQFWWEKMQNSDFWQFWDVLPLQEIKDWACCYRGYVPNFVPRFISIEAFSIVSWQFELVRLFNENVHFSQYANEGKG